MANPDLTPSLSDFSDITPLGPTADQLQFIANLTDWLDLTGQEVLDAAIDLIPKSDMVYANGRERRVDSLVDLRVSEASELIEELKSRKQATLANRRAYGRGR